MKRLQRTSLRRLAAGVLEDAGTPDIKSPAEAPGQAKVDRYILHEELGRGSGGVVWRATDPILRRSAAIKLTPLPNGSSLAARDVQSKFAAMASLSHPGILQVFDGGIAEDPHALPGEGGRRPSVLYYAMEYMPDGTTADLVADHPMEAVAAARLVRQVCRALSEAHRHGVLHLDIKPSNILLQDGLPKLADFSAMHPPATGSPDGRIRIIGTLGFLSPEQAHGRSDEIDQRSDIYGLCATLSALITGSGVGDDEALVGIGEHHPMLVDIIHRGLESAPDKRHRSAAALGAALDEFLGAHRAQQAQAQAKGSPPWLPLGLAAAAVVGLFLRLQDSAPVDRTGSNGNMSERSSSSAAPGPSQGERAASSSVEPNRANLEQQLAAGNYGAALSQFAMLPSSAQTGWTENIELNFLRAQVGAWLHDFSYHPSDLDALGNFLESSGLGANIAGAIRDINSKGEGLPYEFQVFDLLGQLREDPGASVAGALARALEQYPRRPELLLTAAMFDLRERRPKRAEEKLKQLPRDTDHPGRLLLSLLSDLALHGAEIGPDLFQGIVDRFDIMEADQGLAALLGDEQDQLAQALGILSEAVRKHPELATAHHHLAVAQLRSGQPEAALKTLGDFARSVTDDPDLEWDRSWTLEGADEFEGADRTSATYARPSAELILGDPWLAELRQHAQWEADVGAHLPE
jgi:serine/threonine protein kinase/tetratricopeptide (TPR) repeat protein